ncbi:Uncharacterized protein QTN25_007399 [Entamoeba marina]
MDSLNLSFSNMKSSISNFLDITDALTPENIGSPIILQIREWVQSLHQYDLNLVNQLLLEHDILIKTRNVLSSTDDTLRLFYIHHLQVNLRLIIAPVFRQQNIDPLPSSYLNSVIVLLNNIRDILSEIGRMTLTEYFTQYIFPNYQNIPLSMNYIKLHLDGNNDNERYLIDRIIEKTALELGTIKSPTPEISYQPKKQTLADIANKSKKRRPPTNKQTNFFMFKHED